jgi:hypothetical protein
LLYKMSKSVLITRKYSSAVNNFYTPFEDAIADEYLVVSSEKTNNYREIYYRLYVIMSLQLIMRQRHKLLDCKFTC